LLLNCEGLKDRAQHEALDTVISQKRLIASLEQTLAETRRQSKKLEEELGYMKDKHCTTATSLITWKAKALELTARQMGSTSGSVTSNPPVVETLRAKKEDNANRSQLLTEQTSSAEHKLDASSYLSAHIGGDDESHIENSHSREQTMLNDHTFRTEEEENAENVPLSNEFALSAQRCAADRVTRQLVSTIFFFLSFSICLPFTFKTSLLFFVMLADIFPNCLTQRRCLRCWKQKEALFEAPRLLNNPPLCPILCMHT